MAKEDILWQSTKAATHVSSAGPNGKDWQRKPRRGSQDQEPSKCNIIQ